MEPLNAVASVSPSGDAVEIWAGTQSQTTATEAPAKLLGIPRDRVKLHDLLMGGGFGRRGNRDVDFIVESGLSGLVAKAKGVDVALNPRVPIDSPWLDIIANIIVANPTPAAIAYFSAVSNYALATLEREPDSWLVDQTAMYCVLAMMRRFAREPAIAWLAPDAAEGLLWHIGHAYEHLLNDPRYRKYATASA